MPNLVDLNEKQIKVGCARLDRHVSLLSELLADSLGARL